MSVDVKYLNEFVEIVQKFIENDKEFSDDIKNKLNDWIKVEKEYIYNIDKNND